MGASSYELTWLCAEAHVRVSRQQVDHGHREQGIQHARQNETRVAKVLLHKRSRGAMRADAIISTNGKNVSGHTYQAYAGTII